MTNETFNPIRMKRRKFDVNHSHRGMRRILLLRDIVGTTCYLLHNDLMWPDDEHPLSLPSIISTNLSSRKEKAD